MNELDHAYAVLGVSASMTLEEIEDVYDELIEKYSDEAKHNMYYQQKLNEWKVAYEQILDHRMMEEDGFLGQLTIWDSLKEFKWAKYMIGIMGLCLSLVVVGHFLGLIQRENQKLLTEATSPPPFEKGSYSAALYDLANGFTLELGRFKETVDWDWGYFEEGQNWTVVVALEVVESHELGAFINVYNFRLDENHPTTYLSEDIYLDSDLSRVHYLGGFSELIPSGQKFGVVFQVPPFQSGEERFIYYQHPDGSVQTVGSLMFKTDETELEDKGIFVDLGWRLN